jgi:ATP-dependent DNA helicase RecQ
MERRGSRGHDALHHEGFGSNLQVLREVFGRPQFRPGQAEATRAFYAGRDVQLVLPTGAGKSLCYQIPAVRAAREGRGPTLVVSPLIALMDDQVAGLRRLGVRAVALHSNLPWSEQRATLDQLERVDLVYASPERLSSSRFRDRLRRAGLALAAVDEAHCISEWGHDFRPEYRQLDVLKREFQVPIMAVTATANQRVLSDVCQSLGLEEPACIHGGFERPNLRFAVHHRSGDNERLEWVLEHPLLRGLLPAGAGDTPGRAIVYAATRKRCAAVCKALRADGIPAAYYHAGRSESARRRAQAGFEDGRYPVLVATSAFGMGVDLPDVRLVVHIQAPAGLAAYYQQAGRGGRDGDPAECVLLYSPADAVTQARLRAKEPGAEESWRALQDYAFGTRCRQQLLVEHFTGSAGAACGCCDACHEPERVSAEVGAARQRGRLRAEERARRQQILARSALSAAQREQVVRFVEALRKPLGRRLIALGLRGSRGKEAKRRKLADNPTFGALRGVPEAVITDALDGLLTEGRLARMGRKYPTVWIPGKPVRGPRRQTAQPGSRGVGAEIERELRNYQRREARRRRIKPYQVFPRQTLRAIAQTQPRTRAELSEVWGMGETRIENYAEHILEVVNRHAEVSRGAP